MASTARSSASSNQTTCYVVAHDIPDNRRRTKVHEILTGFGKWTQYSLFKCLLSRKGVILLQSKLGEYLIETCMMQNRSDTLSMLQSKLGEYLIETQDSVRFYPLCANCVGKVETIGRPPPQDALLFVV